MTERKRGTVITTKSGKLQGVITLPDGRRKRLKPFPKGTSQLMAETKTAYFAEHPELIADVKEAEPIADVDDDETLGGKWFKLWLADRVARKLTSTRDNAAHWRLHIRPVLGTGSPKGWKRDQFRKLSAALDRKVQEGELSWKSARNVWATATKMANDAAESKQSKIRCRDDDPAAGVKGPDRGDDTDTQFLYPSEFQRFVECEKVPLRWRTTVAVAVYSYLRDAELRVLLVQDVDLEHDQIRVTKAWNRRSRSIGSPKGGKARDVPIEPALKPLLRALVKGRDGAEPLLELPSERDMARGLQRWLRNAKVDRAGLHDDTPTTRKIRFHDLRGTGITWRAVRDDPKFEIQVAAGHRQFSTTERYLHLAGTKRKGFGAVFPALPKPLLHRNTPSSHPSVSVRKERGFSGADGTRTRGLRRDRPAL
jgi:integrase